MSELERAIVEQAVQWANDGTDKSVNGNGLALLGMAFDLIDQRADRAIAAGPGEPSLGELERAVVNISIKLMDAHDVGALFDRYGIAEEWRATVRRLLAARAQAVAE